jgi:hypothetical protein
MDLLDEQLDKPLCLHPLTYLADGDDVTVGRTDINSYGLFPPDAAELLRYLEAGHSPNDAAAWYEQQYGEQVDMVDFLEILDEYQLILRDGERVMQQAPVRWQRLGRAIFSPIGWACYAALLAAAVVAALFEHSLAPHYQNLFFTRSSLVILTLGIVVGQVPWLLLHESFHALAGRRLGLNSTLRIGRRFYYVVLETSLDGLVAVPRAKRYLPMLAGMIADVVVIAALTLGAAPLYSSSGATLYLGKFMLSMAFGVVLRLVWQFYFFLRTDLYYLITTVMGCNDLQTVARQRLQNAVAHVLGRPDRKVSPDTWHPKDRSASRWYVWLMAAGYGFLGATLILAGVPAAVSITELALSKLGTHHSLLNIGDVLLFLVLNFGEIALAGFLAARAYSRRRAGLPT